MDGLEIEMWKCGGQSFKKLGTVTKLSNKKEISMKNYKLSDYWNLGMSITLCATIGIVLGVLLKNLVLWLSIGAGVGVVIGAISMMNKKKKS